MAKLRVGMIGLGMGAGHHARSLNDLSGEIGCVAGFSPTAARREAFAEKYGLPVTDDLDGMFADPGIDAIMIITPPNTHLELVQRAAAAGKHILLEKPLDITLERSEAIVETARNTGVTLAVVLQNRFRPGILALAEVVNTGRLGEIVEASAAIRNWRPSPSSSAAARTASARFAAP